MSNDQYYQVEKIVGFRNIRGVPHYKVHWQSYSRDQDSWEPAKNLAACSVLLDEYHARKAAASPPKTRRTTRHLAATGKSSAEPLPEDEELPVLRRSQRARTPTHHFASKMAATTPRKQQTAAPPTKPKSPRKRQLRLERRRHGRRGI
ncbi:Probable chromo domain-containing protein LHP1 [Geodia barretti]|uniref:Probable chromo domain-containing protein LHP1 n=1 Tax=Geodia barretti TaxID=519541 RepID=A0AA35RH79_GEOBA|nr:Probable chromo domain-containing protein LHP1 [Geodia barretti]